MESINPDDFKIGGKVKLSKIPTKRDVDADDDEKIAKMKAIVEKLSKFQDVMFAHNRYSVLVCIQGMDTSGKDSLIREVFKEFNPRGISVHSFKTPNAAELQHDYLWRHYEALPEKGKFAIFNRSHYENVIVTRVHPEYILNENLPGIENTESITPDFWEKRMRQIVNFEKHLVQNGTIVFKFFMHLSKEKQRTRLLKRLEQPEDNWKFSVGDLQERERWNDYMKYYEEAIEATSTDDAPWHVIPADDKEMARYIVAEIIWKTMQRYTDIHEPELNAEVKKKIKFFEDKLNAE